jgi:hypothetical protein
MSMLRQIASGALLLSLCTTALAQTKVYKTNDAEGNPVFVDTPSQGAQTVEIGQSNIINLDESKLSMPDESSAPARPSVVGSTQEEEPRIIVNSNGDGEELQEGDRWTTERTEDGDILSQEPRHPDGEEFIDGKRVERVERSRRTIKPHGKR